MIIIYCPIYDMSSSAEKNDSGIIVAAVNDVAEKFKSLAPLTNNTAKEKEYSCLPTLKKHPSDNHSLILP